MRIVGVFVVCAVLATSSAFADPCRVMDPELVGQYVGGCRDGLADGDGTAKGASVYQGQFKEGRKQGRGVKVLANGDHYEGEFKEDKRHGKGAYVWGPRSPWAGDRYEGSYRDDRRSGMGLYLWVSGDRYEGMWQDDQRLGLSVMETRRALAQRELEKSLSVGAKACGAARVGIATMERMSGVVLEIAGGTIRVRVLEGGGMSGREPGEVVVDQVVNWMPCG